MEIKLSYVHARTARAHVEDGQLLVSMPRHWPRAEQEAALARFQRWASRRQAQLASLPAVPEAPPLSELDLWTLVERINQQTVQVHVTGVRLGKAKRSRLAQANCRTGVLTFSRYAVNGLPPRVLRYLILHELAHLKIPDHSPRFWALVSRFEPEWRQLRRLAQVHFERAISAPDESTRSVSGPARVAAQLPFDALSSVDPVAAAAGAGSPPDPRTPAPASPISRRDPPDSGSATAATAPPPPRPASPPDPVLEAGTIPRPPEPRPASRSRAKPPAEPPGTTPGRGKGHGARAAAAAGHQMPLFPGLVPEYHVI